MQLKLTYSEVEQLISDKTGKELPLCYGGPHTLRITHKVPLMGSVGVDITIEQIQNSHIILSFGGGAGIEYMLRAALNQAKSQNPDIDSMVQLIGNNQLRLSLAQNGNLAPLLQRVTLNDIHFDEHSLMIDFTPRVDPNLS